MSLRSLDSQTLGARDRVAAVQVERPGGNRCVEHDGLVPLPRGLALYGVHDVRTPEAVDVLTSSIRVAVDLTSIYNAGVFCQRRGGSSWAQKYADGSLSDADKSYYMKVVVPTASKSASAGLELLDLIEY